MGINAEWPKVWKSEGCEYVIDNIKCRTIFIDAQILLMKSFVKDTDLTWREFIQRSFCAVITRHHAKFDTVILCFDNYDSVPIFKSIEQNKRVSTNKSDFEFKRGDLLPDAPPPQHVWVQALQNRSFKSNVISLITTMIAAEYNPPRKATTLVIDFVNCIRIDFTTKEKTRNVITEFNSMGESDVKFMRYVPLFGDICVDSIDSDVLLIALFFVTRSNTKNNVFVRRYKTKIEDTLKKRKLETTVQCKSPKEYEIIDVKLMGSMLHICMKQSIDTGSLLIDNTHMTTTLMFMTLLCGSDYSKKLPRIGVKTVWENMHILIPSIIQVTRYIDNKFSIDIEECMNSTISDIYNHTYQKHMLTHPDAREYGIDVVLAELQSSKLSETIKKQLPNRSSITSMLQNIEWIINYWQIENTNPECDMSGVSGFVMQNNRVVFA